MNFPTPRRGAGQSQRGVISPLFIFFHQNAKRLNITSPTSENELFVILPFWLRRAVHATSDTLEMRFYSKI